MQRLLFSANSFHLNVTKSSLFFVDLLRKHFEVDVVPHKDLFSKIAPSAYDYLVIWQHAFDPRIITASRIPKIMYVPMYDDMPPEPYWSRLANQGVSVLCFSRKVKTVVDAWKARSLFVQYFTQPADRAIQVKLPLKVFFWPRTASIQPGTLKNWLKKWPIKHWHFHGLEHLPRDFGREEVTLSRWFSSRKEYLHYLAQFDVFVAPRRSEGIGLSFLESLGLGQIVVGWDDATMNEYLEHGRTGFLISSPLNSLEPPENLQAVSELAYQSACSGYRQWQSLEPNIIDFIRQSPALIRRHTPVYFRETLKYRLRSSWRKIKSIFKDKAKR